MQQNKSNLTKNTVWVVTLSLLLLFFTIPHTLEDFAYGEPGKAGISPQVLASGVAAVFAVQGLALFWTGQQLRRGYVVHLILGILWPLGASAAQLPEILAPGPYRAGVISEVYVFGIILAGILLALTSATSLIGSTENIEGPQIKSTENPRTKEKTL